MRPLADTLRPETLEDIVGQEHILGKGKLLRRLIESGTAVNLVFYGPPGTGKTTVARLLAQRTQRTLYQLNATTASLQDVKDIVAQLGTMMAPNGGLLYLDEIQYFNKKQQQSLLEFMENGQLLLIASTTENPFFAVYNALLSRSSVFEFRPVPPEAAAQAVERALLYCKADSALPLDWEPDLPRLLGEGCGGDVRKAIGAVELLYRTAAPSPEGKLFLRVEDASALINRSALRYDKDGDEHYDLLSALQKSIRGSDPDAGVHYLARLLESGDLLSPCRRLLVIAAEDIGLAYPLAMPIVKACVDSALQLGLPEARLPLAEAVILLANAPKSNSACNAIHAAVADVEQGRSGAIPRILQNVHADTTGQTPTEAYRYPHDYPHHWVAQQYLPDALLGRQYYHYGENKTEQAAKLYWESIRRDGQ